MTKLTILGLLHVKIAHKKLLDIRYALKIETLGSHAKCSHLS